MCFPYRLQSVLGKAPRVQATKRRIPRISHKWIACLYLLSLVVHIDFAVGLTYCQRGTYEFTPPLGGRDVCELCLPGTFMPFHDHQYRECFSCTTIQDPLLEIIATPCNRTHNTVINCIEGYYWREPRNTRENGVCLKCTECEYPYFEARHCLTYEDTVCCLGENYDVIRHNGGVAVCRDRPWMCRRGYYYQASSSDCVECPNNTFMSQDYHSMTKCWDCEVPLLAKHSVVLESCNSTHPPVYGCKPGFFVNISMGYNKNDIGCSPCTHCNTTDKKYEGRECNQINDSVCCPNPNMTVEDTPDGPKCLSSPKRVAWPTTPPSAETCGPGHYLHINSEGESECQPCPLGSYMDEGHHTRHESKNCNDFNVTELSPRPFLNSKNMSHDLEPKQDTEKCSKEADIVLITLLVISVILNVTAIIFIIQYRRRVRLLSTKKQMVLFTHQTRFATRPCTKNANIPINVTKRTLDTTSTALEKTEVSLHAEPTESLLT